MHLVDGDTEQAGRAQAYDLDAERVVLGILLTRPKAFEDLAGLLTGEDFYNPKHADIFRALEEVRAAGIPVEATAVTGWLIDKGDAVRLGGAPYLLDCSRLAMTAGEIGHYAGRVADMAQRREYEAHAIRLAQAATQPGTELTDLAALAESITEKVRPRRTQVNMTELGALLTPALDDIENRARRKVGIPTGFTDLDKMLGGLRRKQLVTIAAATGMGKSVALVTIARHIAIKLRLTVAFFTLEMANDEVFDRILAAESGVHLRRIRDGELDEQDWQKVAAKCGPMATAPFWLSDKTPMTVPAIVEACTKLREQTGKLDVVFVDHMHNLHPSDRRIVEERARIENVSDGLKQVLAGPLDIPVVAAAQLNRNFHGRADKTPEMSDLKGSSAIEQNSNAVVLVHRPDYYDKSSPRRGEGDFLVVKNRIGDTGCVTVASQLHLSRFVDMAIQN